MHYKGNDQDKTISKDPQAVRGAEVAIFREGSGRK